MLTKDQKRFMLSEELAQYVRNKAEEKDIPISVMLRHIVKEYMAIHA